MKNDVENKVMEEIYVKSTIDGSIQPSLYRASPRGGSRPLLVGLHTWSCDRFNQMNNLLPIAEKYGFNLLLPEFRGCNLPSNPNCTNACGSPVARGDIKDAVEYACSELGADSENVFLIGLSGGGHMALMMAAFHYDMFKAVTSFVPVSDLKRWTGENLNYKDSVLACCSGTDDEMAKRSPISYIDGLAKANLKIFHGKWDNVIPVGQSITLYNKIIEAYPNANVYFDVFDGGHEIDLDLAMHWIMSQYGENGRISVTG